MRRYSICSTSVAEENGPRLTLARTSGDRSLWVMVVIVDIMPSSCSSVNAKRSFACSFHHSPLVHVFLSLTEQEAMDYTHAPTHILGRAYANTYACTIRRRIHTTYLVLRVLERCRIFDAKEETKTKTFRDYSLARSFHSAGCTSL